MKMKFLLVRTDSTCEILEIEQSELFDTIRPIIDCEWIETVHLGTLILLVDELGKLYTVPKDVNHACSLIYPGTPYGDPIVGNVVIGQFGYVNDDPDIVGLTEEQIETLCDMLRLKLVDFEV